jgi:hypothetical protein
MRLIEVPARQRDVHPINVGTLLDPPEGLVEPAYPAEHLGRKSDLTPKELHEPPR